MNSTFLKTTMTIRKLKKEKLQTNLFFKKKHLHVNSEGEAVFK